jgi:ribosomal protein S21
MRNKKQYQNQTFEPLRGGETVGDDSSSKRKKESDEHEPVQAQFVEVKVYNNFDKAMKAFRALVQKERILSTYKETRRFEKPSDKKRRKRNEMKRKRFELEQKKIQTNTKDKKKKQYRVVNNEQSE